MNGKTKAGMPVSLFMMASSSYASGKGSTITGMMCGPPVRSWRIFTSLLYELGKKTEPFDLLHPNGLQNLDATLTAIIEAQTAIAVAVIASPHLLHHHIAGRLSMRHENRWIHPTPKESQCCCNPNRTSDERDSHHGTLSLNSSLQLGSVLVRTQTMAIKGMFSFRQSPLLLSFRF